MLGEEGQSQSLCHAQTEGVRRFAQPCTARQNKLSKVTVTKNSFESQIGSKSTEARVLFVYACFMLYALSLGNEHSGRIEPHQ